MQKTTKSFFLKNISSFQHNFLLGAEILVFFIEQPEILGTAGLKMAKSHRYIGKT